MTTYNLYGHECARPKCHNITRDRYSRFCSMDCREMVFPRKVPRDKRCGFDGCDQPVSSRLAKYCGPSHSIASQRKDKQLKPPRPIVHRETMDCEQCKGAIGTRGGKRFCSTQCYGAYRLAHPKPAKLRPATVRRPRRSTETVRCARCHDLVTGAGRKFCSHQCYGAYKRENPLLGPRLPSVRHRGSHKRLSPEELGQVNELIKTEPSSHKIAELFGVSYHTIYRIRNGTRRQPRAPRVSRARPPGRCAVCNAPVQRSTENRAVAGNAPIRCKRHRFYGWKLTESAANDIRTRLAQGERGTGAQLAREYGVTAAVVYAIRDNRIWRRDK